jgi:hypothetical protein
VAAGVRDTIDFVKRVREVGDARSSSSHVVREPAMQRVSMQIFKSGERVPINSRSPS